MLTSVTRDVSGDIKMESIKMEDTKLETEIIYDSYLPAALQRALEYAGDDGFVASMPQLLHARTNATDGNRVALRADIDTGTQLQSLGVQHGSLLQQTSPSDHPSFSSTYRATIASDRHHPGRPVG